MEAKTRNGRCSSFATDGFANTSKVLMLLGDEGDGKAARGPRRFGSVRDKPEKLLSGGGVKELSLLVHDPNRGRLGTLIHVTFSETNTEVSLYKKYYLSLG